MKMGGGALSRGFYLGVLKGTPYLGRCPYKHWIMQAVVIIGHNACSFCRLESRTFLLHSALPFCISFQPSKGAIVNP